MPDDQHGRSAWLREILDRHESALVRYAQRLTGDLETARDVVQDTFLKLLKQNRAEVEDHLVEWLFTVCRNRALDVVRKERRMRGFTDEQATERIPAGDPAPETEGEEAAEGRHTLAGWLDRLPERQQEVLRLKFQSGLTYQEIARVTALSVSNVGFLIHTGLKALRERAQGDAASNPTVAR